MKRVNASLPRHNAGLSGPPLAGASILRQGSGMAGDLTGDPNV